MPDFEHPEETHEAELQSLLDRARADDVAQQRIRERWLRQQSSEAATFRGLLLDLARRAVSLSLQTRGGRIHQGVLIAVGRDFCTLRTDAGAAVHVALDAVASVRPGPGVRLGGADTDSVGGSALTLGELLSRIVDERPRIHVVLAGDDDVLSGTLESVGIDVLTLRVGGDRAYLSLASLAELSFFGSGCR